MHSILIQEIYFCFSFDFLMFFYLIHYRMAVIDRLCLDVYGLKSSNQLEQILSATKTTRNINYVL